MITELVTTYTRLRQMDILNHKILSVIEGSDWENGSVLLLDQFVWTSPAFTLSYVL
jgi:hypothetical protein